MEIGGPAESSFADPLGLIGDCHRRIERFLGMLQAVSAGARGGPLAANQRAALERALTYFREAAPRHTADEDESLFPRLRHEPSAAEALVQVDALHAEHHRLDELHADVERLGAAWLAQDALPAGEWAVLEAALQELAERYGRHIALEDSQILPLARRCLPPEQLEGLGREMAARRGLDYDALSDLA